MRQGYSVAWVGWQIDVPRQDGLMVLDAPRVPGVSGFVRCRLRPNEPAEVLPLADRYHRPNPCIELDDPDASVTVRENGGAPAAVLPREGWRFTDAGHVSVKGGFKPGVIYDVVYRSSNPLLVGASFLAVRDTAAFLRWGTAAEGNPCAGGLERAYLFGVSQSGRFLREMLYLGLDEDEQGRMVFDAVWPHVAGGRRGEFNLRFGQPSLNSAGTVGGLPPFNDEGLFANLRKRGKQPKIFATNTSAEYWRGDASLIHTDDSGTRDAEPADFVRTYLFAGTQHTPGAIPPPATDANTGARGANMFNIVDYAPLLRGALVNLDAWVSKGTAPPPSAFPRLSNGTAVQPESLGPFFKKLPGVTFAGRFVRPAKLDFGPDIARGIAAYPAKAGAQYPAYVSAIDDDGNEVAGIIPVESAAPLATFTGWNPRHPDQGAADDLMQMRGSTLVFAPTRAAREASGDPRLSSAERYASRAAYLAAVRTAAQTLVAARHVLAEDIDAIIDRAGLRWDFLHTVKETR
jgi:Alpha/beta hydrolase domain